MDGQDASSAGFAGRVWGTAGTAKRIEFTDFPELGIRFYYAYWVIHLPSEY